MELLGTHVKALHLIGVFDKAPATSKQKWFSNLTNYFKYVLISVMLLNTIVPSLSHLFTNLNDVKELIHSGYIAFVYGIMLINYWCMIYQRKQIERAMDGLKMFVNESN